MSDELQNFGKGRCNFLPSPCVVCGRIEPCRCAVRPRPEAVVTPVVSEGWTQEYPGDPFLHVESSLEPRLPCLSVISVEIALKAILGASQGAKIGFWTDHQRHALDVLRDIDSLLETGAFRMVRARREGLITFAGGGQIIIVTNQKVSQGHFRGMTFARVWDVRRYGHQR